MGAFQSVLYYWLYNPLLIALVVFAGVHRSLRRVRSPSLTPRLSWQQGTTAQAGYATYVSQSKTDQTRRLFANINGGRRRETPS